MLFSIPTVMFALSAMPFVSAVSMDDSAESSLSYQPEYTETSPMLHRRGRRLSKRHHHNHHLQSNAEESPEYLYKRAYNDDSEQPHYAQVDRYANYPSVQRQDYFDMAGQPSNGLYKRFYRVYEVGY